MFGGVEQRSWRPPVAEPRLVKALERGALVCLVIESVSGARVAAVVLPWPRVLGGCLVFHDRGPTRRVELPAADLPAASVGDLYAAEPAGGDQAFAWPPVDVTAQARAFTA